MGCVKSKPAPSYEGSNEGKHDLHMKEGGAGKVIGGACDETATMMIYDDDVTARETVRSRISFDTKDSVVPSTSQGASLETQDSGSLDFPRLNSSGEESEFEPTCTKDASAPVLECPDEPPPTDEVNKTVLSGLIDTLTKEKSERSCSNQRSVQIVTADKYTIESVFDGVQDGPVLGYGITGVVRKVTHKETGAEYAVKTLSLSLVETENGLRQLREELTILMELDHPNIVRLEGVYESDENIYLVQELCRGGDLFDRLDAQPDEHYSEKQCARLIKQMLSAVRYIHSKGIIHRDLKLENFLFDTMEPDAELMMIDFGLSKHFKSGECHHEPVGTRYTVAPEVLNRVYDEKADIWAVGVITFLLLSGEAPFGGCGYNESNEMVRDNILNGRYAFEPEEYWYHVSDDAKAFISSILVVDPAKRPDAKECQRNKWLRATTDSELDRNIPGLRPNVLESLRAFRGFSDLRKLLCEVIGFTLLPEQIASLRREFEKLDVEGTGEITLSGLKKILLESGSSDFTPDEVEEIFDSMRLHKDNLTIHWHHFLAAELSQCAVDERNHRLAFDRLDTEKKGYITFDDVINLMGPETLMRRESSLKELWGDSVQLCRRSSRIQYSDFVKIMKQDDDTEGMLMQQSEAEGIVI